MLRIADGKGGSHTKSIGFADDYDEADGQKFLTFFEAQDKAKTVARADGKNGILKPLTMAEAASNYLDVLRAKNMGTAYDTELRLKKHFLPRFGDRLAADLTKTMLERWLASLVVESDDPEKVRKSKDTANRVLTMVKALLNHAMQDQSNGLKDDSAWRLVKPFPHVGRPREIRYTSDEVKKIIASAPDDAFADLIRGAFLTGARLGELTSAHIYSVDFNQRTLHVSGKTGPRSIILQANAVEFLKRLTDGRAADDFLFVRSDGSRWKKSEQTRPFKEALSKAGLSEVGSLYAMRHTYISHAIEQHMPHVVIARNCGTSVRMIEKTYAKLLSERERELVERGAPILE